MIDPKPYQAYVEAFRVSDNEPQAMLDLYTDGIRALLKEMREQVYGTDNINGDTSVIETHANAAVMPIDYHLRLMACIYHMERKYVSEPVRITKLYGVFARIMSNIKAKYPPTSWRSKPENNLPLNYVTDKLRSISKQCTESMVTDLSPIVPYAGQIRPMMIQIMKSELDESMDPVRRYLGLESITPEKFTPQMLACQTMTSALMDFDKIFEIFDHINMIASYKDNANGSDYFVTDAYRHCPLSVAQYIACIVSIQSGYDNNGYQTFMRLMEVMENGKDIQPRIAAVEALLDATAETATAEGEDAIPSAREISQRAEKFYSGAVKTSSMEKDGPRDMSIDLTAIRNFLHISRRFSTDEYCNQSFMKSKKVRSITYIEDFMIIEPEAMDGGQSNFVYIPLIDNMNWKKIIVAKYWRSTGDIDLLTMEQYENEINTQISNEETPAKTGEVENPNDPSTVELPIVE